MNGFSDIDYWKIHDLLSVEQAAMLAVGINPGEMDLVSEIDGKFHKKDSSNEIKNFMTSPKFVAVASAIRRAISSGKIKEIQEEYDTYIEVEKLKEWMKGKGFLPPFFFPDGAAEGFRDKKHPRYSSKLACAVAAWEAVEKSKPNKSVKETVKEWVNANAVLFGMVDTDGIPSGTAVEEVAKVVNWDTRGGANRTGGEVDFGAEASISETNYSTSKRGGFSRDLDEEIPF